MGILRLFAATVGKITTFRCYQILLVLGAALAVMAFYYFGSDNQNFSSTTKRIKQQTRASNNSSRNDADLSADTASVNHEGKSGVVNEAADSQERRGDRRYYHVLMMFTKIDKSRTLQSKFEVAMRSMTKHGHFLEDEVLVLHYVSDAASKGLGEKMLPELLMNATFRHEVVFHDVDVLTEKLFPIVEAMQKHFSAGSGTYYSDSIFFLSVAMHRILPEEMKRVVQLDLDLKFRSNIRDLFQEFEHFPPETVIGIVREMQPVYRHTFWQYRKERPHSGVGDPPPQGLPGFNSGVMLLDLHAMRHSALYNQLLEPEQVARLAERYHFRGHLGDQDFFTMIGMERPELFHLLPCGWNRQLCTWWRDHGYTDVFQLYYQCDGPVHIYHGNCNTPIPDD